MNKLKNVAVILLLFVGYSQATAQNEPELLAEKFFTTYEESGPTVALDELYASSKWINKAEDAVLKLKNQMEGLNEDYVGKYYGYELIVEKKISSSFILLSYMVKFDRQPLRYTFKFYKPNDKWVTYSFQYDGNLGTELEEAAKIYFLDSGE
jgi:hypothetical protein